MQAKCKYCLVDYNTHTVPGVERLGKTVADIAKNTQFDVLICNHVLEHVAEPVGFLKELWPFLKPEGKAYFEVPLQIWRDIPIQQPAEHINFFTCHSLANALHQAGFHLLRRGSLLGSYGGKRLQVAWAVAERGKEKCQLLAHSVDATGKLVHPGPLKRIWKVLAIDVRVSRSLKPVFSLISRAFKKAMRIGR